MLQGGYQLIPPTPDEVLRHIAELEAAGLTDGPEWFNIWADYWRYVIGGNVIPAIGRIKNFHKDLTYTRWQNAPISDEQYEQWKAENKFNDGMAVLAGRTWHREDRKHLYLNLIDCDNQKAIDEVICTSVDGSHMTLQQAAQYTIIEQHAGTPNKAHVYVYSTRPFPKKSSDNNGPLADKLDANEIPAMEVKGEGGHGVHFVCPSLHPDGTAYQIIGTKEPAILDGFDKHIDSVLVKYGIPYLSIVSDDGSNKAQILIEELFKEDYRILKDHNRHGDVLRIMDSLISRNKAILTLEEIKQWARNWNEKHCLPPLDDKEFEKQWRCALGYIIREETKRLAQQAQNDDNNGDNNNNSKGGKRKRVEQKRDDLYQKLKTKFTFKTTRDSQEILWYDAKNGVYRFNGEAKIKEELEKIYEEELQNGQGSIADLLTENDRNEIVKRIQWNTLIERKDFENDSKPIINIKNGLLDVATATLLPHSPEYLSVKQFPIIYDPNAKWTEVLNFFKQVQNREGVITLLKMFGYILMTNTVKYQKAFFFAGKGDNGKSVVIDLTEAFVGEDNCSSVKLHDLKNDRFMAARMYGKIVNTYADIPGTSLQDVGLFKALVSGDKITVQNKYGKLFEIRNRAKLIFSGNNIPLSEGEDSLAYFKRWVILRFEALFQGDKQDRNLINKLKTLENLSGLLNLALVGIKLLERAEYERQSVSLSKFIETQCAINLSKKEYFIPKDDFYNSYLKYCKDNPSTDIDDGDGPLSYEKVEVELANYKVFEKRITIDKKKRDCYYGVITLEEANRRNQQVLERQKQNTL